MVVSSRAAVLASLVAIVVAGCGGDGSGDPATLEGTSWVVTEGVSAFEDAEITMPTATFTAIEVAGTTGCNRYGARYTIDGDAMTISTLAMTNVACSSSADVIEKEFTAALGTVEAWDIDGDSLSLLDGEGVQVLGFEPAPTS